MKQAQIVKEYEPFPGVDTVHGVTYDGENVWFAAGDKLNAIDPASGAIKRSIGVAAHAGTAFDGRHLYQIAEARIQKIDPQADTVGREHLRTRIRRPRPVLLRRRQDRQSSGRAARQGRREGMSTARSSWRSSSTESLEVTSQ
jgi:hypothetical protein